MQLTKNFTLEEFLISQTAARLNIDNTPSPSVISNLQLLCTNVLQPLRDKLGQMSISSGYRCSILNSRIGGAADSQHLYGQAADITIPTMGNAALAEYIRDNLMFDQVILEFYQLGVPQSGWVHVSYTNGINRQQCLTAVKQNGKTVYLKGIVA
jgi:hypothetical protein